MSILDSAINLKNKLEEQGLSSSDISIKIPSELFDALLNQASEYVRIYNENLHPDCNEFLYVGFRVLRGEKKQPEKKEITLYRYTYEISGSIWQSAWRSDEGPINPAQEQAKILKTETKIVSIG